MLGYIGKSKKLVFQLVRGLVPLFLIVPTHVRAQTQSTTSTDRPKRARGKTPKKQPPEDRAFVLVGAGDIASCKDPEGARATAKLIEQIPGTKSRVCRSHGVGLFPVLGCASRARRQGFL